MNFLAHLWLADVTGTSAAGSILGDVIHGVLDDQLPAPLALGVRIHRRVDAVTDAHPMSVAWRARFDDGARRYAGIVLDLLCDHALARDWPHHHPTSLSRFSAQAGAALAAEAAWFERYGSWTPAAASFATLLQSYATWGGFERAVARTATRLRQPQRLIDAATGSAALLDEVRAGLPTLLADLRAAAQMLQAAAPASASS